MLNKITITDATTNTTIEREMTEEELAARNAMLSQDALDRAEVEAKAQELKELKTSAYEKLGLTQEEIEALLPTPKPRIIPQASA
jgi:hypothetical protein